MWTKLDDSFPNHPKVLAAGPDAAWLFVCGLCYTNRLLTDGFIPAPQIRMLADVPDARALAEKLVEAGLWEHIEGGYRVHDFHDFNLTAAEAKERQEQLKAQRSEAGKKGMASRWGTANKEDNKITNGITGVIAKPLQPSYNEAITPPPSSHIPHPTTESRPGDDGAQAREPAPPKTRPAPKPVSAKTTFPRGFEVTDAMFNKVRSKFPELDIGDATEEWQNWAKSKGERYVDWEAAWYNAMTRAEKWRTERSKEARGNGTGKHNGRPPNRFDTYREAAEDIRREAEQVEAIDLDVFRLAGPQRAH